MEESWRDELRTRQRREGIYYGSKNFLRKLASAFATSLALQVLGWFEYQSPPVDATQFTQTPRALSAIRFLIGPVGALLLLASACARAPSSGPAKKDGCR